MSSAGSASSILQRKRAVCLAGCLLQRSQRSNLVHRRMPSKELASVLKDTSKIPGLRPLVPAPYHSAHDAQTALRRRHRRDEPKHRLTTPPHVRLNGIASSKGIGSPPQSPTNTWNRARATSPSPPSNMEFPPEGMRW